jgi:TrmH family RNA methyltransferase
MGSVLRLPVVRIKNIGEFVNRCRQKGFQTLATVLTGEKAHFDVNLKKPTLLIVGQEAAGLPQDIMTVVDIRISIPMVETIDSLNVAVSAAVILYEAMRQRMRG